MAAGAVLVHVDDVRPENMKPGEGWAGVGAFAILGRSRLAELASSEQPALHRGTPVARRFVGSEGRAVRCPEQAWAGLWRKLAPEKAGARAPMVSSARGSGDRADYAR